MSTWRRRTRLVVYRRLDVTLGVMRDRCVHRGLRRASTRLWGVPPSLLAGRKLWSRRHDIAWALAVAPVFQLVPPTVQIVAHPRSVLHAACHRVHADASSSHGSEWPDLSSVEVVDADAPIAITRAYESMPLVDTGLAIPDAIERP